MKDGHDEAPPPIHSVALATVSVGCAVLAVLAILAFRVDEEHPLHECLTIADDHSAIFAPDGTRIEDICGYCLGCHDEIIGPGVRTERPAKQPEPFQHPDWVQHPGLPANHPLHIPYPAGKPGFHEKQPKASEIALVRGEVTCISCHDCRELDRRLVVEPRSTEFCLDCHAK